MVEWWKGREGRRGGGVVGGLKECAKCCEGREESKLLIGGEGFPHVVLSLPVAYTIQTVVLFS